MTPLAKLLARLPRVGEATASRLAAAIVDQPHDWRKALAREVLHESAPGHCSTCGDELGQGLCGHDDGDPEAILVVATPKARRMVSKAWNGRYHVLGALLPDGAGPGLRLLLDRCRDPQLRDVVLALGPSPKAKATEIWIANALRSTSLDVWAIGRGVGFGRELEHAGDDEIVESLAHRRPL